MSDSPIQESELSAISPRTYSRPSPCVEKLDVGYPVFAAQFLSDDRLVIGGGGGEGNNGISNKIVGNFVFIKLMCLL